MLFCWGSFSVFYSLLNSSMLAKYERVLESSSFQFHGFGSWDWPMLTGNWGTLKDQSYQLAGSKALASIWFFVVGLMVSSESQELDKNERSVLGHFFFLSSLPSEFFIYLEFPEILIFCPKNSEKKILDRWDICIRIEIIVFLIYLVQSWRLAC